MKPIIDYSLYLVTDRDIMTAPSLAAAVDMGIRGGCTVVQLREKAAESEEFYRQALAVKKITDKHGVPLIINDRADIALAVDAAGVHVGQRDLPASAARAIVGPDRIVGVSVSRLDEALAAAADGADYLGVGAMFATGTKAEAEIVSLDVLGDIRAAVSIPLVVIGGINLDTVPLFRGAGIDGLAVVSAILARDDMEKAARDLRTAFREFRV